MRYRYLVSYDISDQKRWRKVFKTMRGFGDSVQYSVFLCTLSKEECLVLQSRLMDVIDLQDDRVMIVNIGVAASDIDKNVKFLGKKVVVSEQEAIII